MKFEQRTTNDLKLIAYAGGGFRLDASNRTVEELREIAYAAKNRGARIVFAGMGTRTTQELSEIGYAGEGSVSFEA